MRTLRKIVKILLAVIVGIALLAGIWWVWPESTPAITSDKTQSIARIEYLEIGGVEQCVLVRGKDVENPILLFLHGGPGMPMMYLAHEFQRPLEEDFVVVQWDRRGAGKTFARNKPPVESMTVRQLLTDAYSLIDTLRERFDEAQVFLVGHSFGSYLGSIMVQERPELFRAYISVGQVVDSEQAKKIQKAFVEREAKRRGREDVLKVLAQPNSPSMEKWLFEFGGELKNSQSFLPLIWSGIQSKEYTLPEVVQVAAASSFSSKHMQYDVLKNSIYDEIRTYQIPVYFLVGASDYTTPHELIATYYNLVEAPEKELIYFEDSAHFPFFEEPKQFCKEVKRLLLGDQ